MIVLEMRPLATLPVPSTSFTTEPTFIDPGGEVELRFEFERDGVAVRSGLRFETARAFRWRAEGHCTPWHIEGYDTLVEVNPSDWAAELRAAEYTGTYWEIRHFLIYVDSVGAYEIAAASWSWLAEEVAS